MSGNTSGLHHLIAQLRGWVESKSMFKRVPAAPTTTAKAAAPVDPLQAKEAKWGAHRDALPKELELRYSDSVSSPNRQDLHHRSLRGKELRAVPSQPQSKADQTDLPPPPPAPLVA